MCSDQSLDWWYLSRKDWEIKVTMIFRHLRLLHLHNIPLPYFLNLYPKCNAPAAFAVIRTFLFDILPADSHSNSECSGAFPSMHQAGGVLCHFFLLYKTTVLYIVHYSTEGIIMITMCFLCMSPGRVISYPAVSISTLTCNNSHPLHWIV